MTNDKIQNKSKIQMSNIKTKNVLLFVICALTLFCALCFGICHYSFAQDKPTSGELIVKAWEVHGKKDVEATFQYTQQLIDLYKARLLRRPVFR